MKQHDIIGQWRKAPKPASTQKTGTEPTNASSAGAAPSVAAAVPKTTAPVVTQTREDSLATAAPPVPPVAAIAPGQHGNEDDEIQIKVTASAAPTAGPAPSLGRLPPSSAPAVKAAKVPTVGNNPFATSSDHEEAMEVVGDNPFATNYDDDF